MAGPLEPAGLPTTCGPVPVMMIFPRDLVTAPLINKVSDVIALISFSAAPEHIFPSRETFEPGKNRIRFRYRVSTWIDTRIGTRIRIQNQLKLSLNIGGF